MRLGVPLAVLVAAACSGCELFGVEGVDGGSPDAATGDAGGSPVMDGGRVLEPLALDFIQVFLAVAPERRGLVTDGTTLYAAGSTGSPFAGTFQGAVVASEDEGRTWTLRGGGDFSGMAALADGGLFATNSAGLFRSLDGARSFTAVPLPPSIPPTLPLAPLTSADGALWLVSGRAGGPFALARSTDLGVTFSSLSLPSGTTRLWPCLMLGDRFAAVREGNEVLTSTGGALESLPSLGTVSGLAFCVVTRAGTVLVTADVGSAWNALRLPAGASSWERSVAKGAWRFAGAGDTVLRWLTDGSLEASTDDGVTWTPRGGTLPLGTGIESAVLQGSTAVSLSGATTSRLAAGATSWDLVTSPGLPVVPRVVDLSFSGDGPGRALLLEDNIYRTLYVSEDGFTWRRGRTLPQGASTALAISPPGDRVVLGSVDGSYRVFADAGTTMVAEDQIQNLAGTKVFDPIVQLAWSGDATNQVVFAALATAQDTRGALWSWVGAGNTWNDKSPLARPGGFHALATTSRPGVGHALIVSHRSSVGGAALHSLWTALNAWESAPQWLQGRPPAGLAGPLTASCNGVCIGGALALLWPDNLLRVGASADALREVPLPDGIGAVRVARFDPAGNLWLGTASGLWRSRAPVMLP